MQEAKKLDESALRNLDEHNATQISSSGGVPQSQNHKLSYKNKKESAIDDARRRAAEQSSNHWGLSSGDNSHSQTQELDSTQNHNKKSSQSNSKMQNGYNYVNATGPGHDSGSNGSYGAGMQQIENQFSNMNVSSNPNSGHDAGVAGQGVGGQGGYNGQGRKTSTAT